jgi:hypothetical protein
MDEKWSAIVTLGIFSILLVVSFVSGIALLFAFWNILRLVGVNADFWAMTEALATAGGAATVLGAGFIAYRELSEISSSRHMDVADRLFEEMNSPENIEARRWVYQNLPPNPEEGIESLTPKGQAAVKKVLNSLDRIAFLTQSGWMPVNILMPWIHPMIAKSWEKLEAYVIFERNRRNEPYFYEHAGGLAESCKAWRQKNITGEQVSWVDKAI